MSLKKKEIAIYAIALMLVAAGYFNYLKFDINSIETSANISKNEVNMVLNNESENNKIDYSQNEGIKEQDDVNIEKNNDSENQTTVASNETGEKEEQNKINIGDAVLVNSNETAENNESNNNYYAETKLERNQMYAEMIKNYENMINNTDLSEVQKSIATEEIAKINNNKNAIMICENLILTKGFNNCVILINDKNINIVVNIDGGLNTERVSQIQNIISRELSVEIENIHISEK